MALYRNKKNGTLIEAIRWDGRQLSGIPAWAFSASMARVGEYLEIHTPGGCLFACRGDYILFDGGPCPCKPDVFERLYEQADATADTPFEFSDIPKIEIPVYEMPQIVSEQ